MARPFLIAGSPRSRGSTAEVVNPLDGSVVDTVAIPNDDDVEDAVAAASATFDEARRLPAHVRLNALTEVSEALAARSAELAETIAREGGKPLKWARSEAQRAVSTFRIAAEETRRLGGEVQRLDTEDGLGSRLGIVRRFPVGPVLGITPFNFPLNLVAHKVAPAIAAGAPIVVKPAPATPLSALALGEIVASTALPAGMISVLPVPEPERAQRLVQDERFAVLSFTGSAPVGWRLKELVPRKKVILELGGNAGVIVHDDADLDHAAARVAMGGYYQAGQSCISTQRVLVQSRVYDAFCERLVKEVANLKVGDTMDPATDVGPLINVAALDRVEAWVQEAIDGGARALCGGRREDPFYVPTVLADTTPAMKVCAEEVFGPVVAVSRYETFDEAIATVNFSPYGLQAGVFTRDVDRVFLAHRDLEVGAVIANDQSAYRADQMPYGGTKDSGVGREGLRYAIEEMTEPRLLVISKVPL
ncbi:MAG TPA: aldehyde dehydrogenase family protein [Actinomycetota bacterium]